MRTPVSIVFLAAALAAVPWDRSPAADAAAPCDRPATTILVVRHADRVGKADSLSAEGVARAQSLAHALANAGVRAVYHSDTKRTRDTAAPLAAVLGIAMEEYPAKEIDALVARILQVQEGNTVLVVGHSNTVPMIVAAAGGPALADLDEKEFDGLYMVTVDPCRSGPAALVHLQYGATSP